MALAMSADSTTRRNVLQAGAFGLIAGALALGAKLFGPVIGRRPEPSRRITLVGAPASLPVGARQSVGEVIVIHDVRGLAAVSSRCTHLGCQVTANSNGFECPCHGSAFARDGRVLHGPATGPLEWYALFLGDDGEIRVDLNEPVASSTRLQLDGGSESV